MGCADFSKLVFCIRFKKNLSQKKRFDSFINFIFLSVMFSFCLWEKFTLIRAGRGKFAPEQKTQLLKNAQLYRCFYYKNQRKNSHFMPACDVMFRWILVLLQVFFKRQFIDDEEGHMPWLFFLSCQIKLIYFWISFQIKNHQTLYYSSL